MDAAELKNIAIESALRLRIGWESDYNRLNAVIVSVMNGPPSIVQKKVEVQIADVSDNKHKTAAVIRKLISDGYSVQKVHSRYIIKMPARKAT